MWSKETFDTEKVYAAFSIIDNSCQDNSDKSVLLIGGEPLLKKNFLVVSDIVNKSIERNFKVSAITNGYEIEEYKNIIGKNGISYLQITVDGDEHSHNKRRPHFSEKESFKKIIDNISIALNKKVNISLRINVDSQNINTLNSLIEIFEKRKWNHNSHFRCYLTPIRSCDNAIYQSSNNKNLCSLDGDLLKTHSVNEILKNKKKQNSKYSIFQGVNSSLKDSIEKALLTKTSIVLKGNFCGATGSNIVFDPKGDIYSCLEFVGYEDKKIGKYYPLLDNPLLLKNKFSNRQIYNMDGCSECKYALICGGGCMAMAEDAYGNLMKSYCDNFPKIFKQYMREAFLEKDK